MDYEDRAMFADRLDAIAYQQQTTNLIAYLAAAGTSRIAYQIPENVLKAIQADIEQRLGLA